MPNQQTTTTMIINKLLILIILLPIIVALSNQQQSLGSDSIHLSQIQSLTLHRDRYTSGRRTRPIPQLKCTYKPDSYEPDTVQCTNKGTDGKTFNWECKANLRDGYRFGKLNVNCEGYRYSGDDHVLVGSCSLEYTLEKTTTQQNNHHNQHHNHRTHRNNQQANQRNYHQTPHYEHEPIPSNPSSLGFFTIVIIVLAVVGCIWLSKQNSSSSRVYEQQQPTRTYPSMYPDTNPNFNPNLHQTTSNTESSSSSWTESSSIPSFLAGAAVGYAGSTLYNSQRNSGSGSGSGNGSYFESSSYANNYSNYENQSSSAYSHHHHHSSSSDDDSREHTEVGYAETSSR